jgi:hypothetical protein
MKRKTKLHVTLTRRGDTIHVRVHDNGLPLSDEDSIRLQILEYQITNTDHGMIGTKELWL